MNSNDSINESNMFLEKRLKCIEDEICKLSKKQKIHEKSFDALSTQLCECNKNILGLNEKIVNLEEKLENHKEQNEKNHNVTNK
jgi:septal ring factor EnvC (AmiA/AmiB activator)